MHIIFILYIDGIGELVQKTDVRNKYNMSLSLRINNCSTTTELMGSIKSDKFRL